MKRVKWNVVDYNPDEHINKIDYSEKVTEPGLVLSMREIYYRYAAAGVDLLDSSRLTLEDDDYDEDILSPEFEEKTDAFEVSKRIFAADKAAKRSASSGKRTKSKDQPVETKKEPATPEDKPDDTA